MKFTPVSSSRSHRSVRGLSLAGLVLLAILSGCGGGSGSVGLDLVSSANAGPTESNGSAGSGNPASPPSIPAGTGNAEKSEPALPPTLPGSGASPSTPPPATVPVATAPFSCAPGAITCVEVASTSAQAQASVPVTFGQPFKAGDWKHKETGLVARDNFNSNVPLQFDEVSSHRDGSARFAVLSAQLAGLQAGERRIVNIFTGSNSATPGALPADPAWNLEVEAKVYVRQTTLVTFGNRSGNTAGIPFQAGETITLKLSGPTVESYSLTLNAAQAGGGHATLTKIAEAFMQLINAQSSTFLAEKPGTGGGYEKLWITTRNPNGGAFSVQFIYGGPAQISHVNESNYQAPQVWTVKAQDLLKQAVAASNASQIDPKRRLHGVAATEFGLSAPFRNASGTEHPHLTARLDTRLYEAGARIRTDVVLENNWTFKPDPRNITYELSIKHGSQVVHHQPAFTHYHHARWHKVVWKGAQPSLQVRHHMPYFLASRAVWNYDLSLQINSSALANEATQLANARKQQEHLGPMGNALLQPGFGNTGGRPEIGPYPRWTALYLITQDERAWASVIANADAAAAVPIHYRDENTGHPIDAVKHPSLSVYGSAHTVPSSTDQTIWAPDTAHQASYAYVPYLITGDLFYQDEAIFWAAWNIISLPAGYRGHEKSLVDRNQVRGQAWALRSIGEAFRMLADKHPMKDHFKTVLESNLAHYKAKYVNNPNVSSMGAIQHLTPHITKPWQNDFVGVVFSQLAENQEPHALETLEWFNQFNVGRFMSDSSGFCAARGPGYDWTNVDSQGNYVTQWSALFALNYPADVGKPCSSLSITEGYPREGAGYAAYARGMLGASASLSGTAATAYLKWKGMTPEMDSAFKNDPTWAIVPR